VSTKIIRVDVAYVDASGNEFLVALDLPDGATVADAIGAPRVVERIPAGTDTSACAVFGRRAGHGLRLADGDRVEITRPLARDPAHARRARAAAVRARRSPKTDG
jgi:putative ubiquitin-RnfH superfamily antitoxin RatB of RatAB toxin-antitoxin module